MVFNVILYKCKKSLIKGLKENHFSDQKIKVITNSSELNKMNKKAEKGILVYEGRDYNEIIDTVAKLNENNTYFIVFLISNKEAKKMKYMNEPVKEVFYLSEYASYAELAYLLKIIYGYAVSHDQLLEYNNIIKAFEQVVEFSRKELMDAYDSIKAHETVTELGRSEMLNVKESLQAWEKVSEFSRKELMERLREKEALNKVHELSNKERVFMRKVLVAWEHAMDLGRQELLKAYEELKDCQKDKDKK